MVGRWAQPSCGDLKNALDRTGKGNNRRDEPDDQANRLRLRDEGRENRSLK